MWIIWTLMESATKAFEKYVAKGMLGVSVDSIEIIFTITLFIGAVQFTSGMVSRLWVKEKLFSGIDYIGLSMLFGAVSVTMQFTFILAYAKYGADLAIAALISSTSIIPALLMDRLFGDRLFTQQYFGMAIFLLAVYAMLGFPSIAELIVLPLWVFIVAINALLSVINESISRRVKKMHALTKNFWVGLSSLIISSIALTILSKWNYYYIANLNFYFGAILLGFCSLGIVSFKLISYGGGASVMPKKLLLRGSNLIIAAMIGIIWLGEYLSFGKILGIALFFVAFPMVQKKS